MRTRLCGAAIRIAVSLVACGGALVAWLGVLLALAPNAPPWLEALLWLLAPVVTAAGLAGGMALAERWTRAAHRPRHWIVLFPLIGTTVGAAIVYSFGPMLIVFGMFALGAAAMGLLEILRATRERST